MLNRIWAQRFAASLLLTIALIPSPNGVAATLQDDDQESVGVTVKGKVVQANGQQFKIDLSELNAGMNQLVQLPQPPYPKDWAEWTIEKRQVWLKDFETSDEGKTLVAARKKRIDDSAKFELKFDSEGNYSIYDVPVGTYSLRGRTEKKLDGATYVLEVFAQVVVADEVDEVLLDPIPVLATRILQAGDALPQFSVNTFDDKAKLETKLLTNKIVLLNFWSMESQPSLEFAESIQTAYSKLKGQHKIQLVSICIQPDPKKALRYVKENGVKGWHGYVKNWDSEVLEQFGVRGIPALFLIGDDGKIKTTNQGFRQKFRVEGAKLEEVIDAAIQGGAEPTPVADAKVD
ncbi:MAG: thioredoxin family protein [Planctomycetota bacterium]